MKTRILKTDVARRRTFEEWLLGSHFRNLGVYHPKHSEAAMWLEDEETIQTWVNGGEVILKKIDREYAYRLANEAGDWIDGLPDGMVWADAQTLFGDSL